MLPAEKIRQQAAAKSDKSSIISRLSTYLTAPIDGASLAVFRMWFGICLAANVYVYMGKIPYLYVEPKLLFPFFPSLPRLSAQGVYINFEIVAAMALAMTLGLYYRAASAIFLVAWTSILLLDKTYFQNHYYLIGLLGFLFLLTPANRLWSLDNKLEQGSQKKETTIPRWSLLVFKWQIFIAYFFGGIAKLNADWLQGMPQRVWVLAGANNPALSQIVQQDWFVHLITYGGIAVDLGVGFLLFYRRTFWLGAAIAVLFHVLNSRLFPVGIFPYLMIGTIGLFAPPDWPRRIKSLVRQIGKSEIDALTGEMADRFGQEPGAGSTYTASKAGHFGNYAIIGILIVYFAAQLVLPFRYLLFSKDVNWADQGRRCSWRMMLRDKQVDHFAFSVIDPVSHQVEQVKPEEYMNRDQAYIMSWTPDMILQFAHSLADETQKQTGVRPIVHADITASLNFRKYQPLVDPTVDLASRNDSWYQTYDWVVPLDPKDEPPTDMVTIGERIRASQAARHLTQ